MTPSLLPHWVKRRLAEWQTEMGGQGDHVEDDVEDWAVIVAKDPHGNFVIEGRNTGDLFYLKMSGDAITTLTHYPLQPKSRTIFVRIDDIVIRS